MKNDMVIHLTPKGTSDGTFHLELNNNLYDMDWQLDVPNPGNKPSSFSLLPTWTVTLENQETGEIIKEDLVRSECSDGLQEFILDMAFPG